jgi:hypothetical protein
VSYDKTKLPGVRQLNCLRQARRYNRLPPLRHSNEEGAVSSQKGGEMRKYTIAHWEGSFWVWAGDGDDENGCWADIPYSVAEAADNGFRGEMNPLEEEAEEEIYRILDDDDREW